MNSLKMLIYKLVENWDGNMKNKEEKPYANEQILKRIKKAEKNKDKLPHIKLKPTKKTTVTYIDPPKGWAFGFPKILPDPKPTDMKQWLIDNGYPEKDVDFALEWCRLWKEEIEE